MNKMQSRAIGTRFYYSGNRHSRLQTQGVSLALKFKREFRVVECAIAHNTFIMGYLYCYTPHEVYYNLNRQMEEEEVQSVVEEDRNIIAMAFTITYTN